MTTKWQRRAQLRGLMCVHTHFALVEHTLACYSEMGRGSLTTAMALVRGYAPGMETGDKYGLRQRLLYCYWYF